MRPRLALALSLAVGLASSGSISASSSVSLCGGADATPLDSSQVRFGLSASVSLADLDGDGTLEILSADAQGWVHVWKADGSRFDHWPNRAGGGPIFGSPSVGDIDGDGRPDVVATQYFEVRVYAWRASGGSIRGFPKRIGDLGVDFLRGGAMLADLNGDSLLDVVAGSTQGIVHAFTYPFRKEVAGWPVDAGSNFQVTPTSADLDLDGRPEVILDGGDGVGVFGADGSLLPGWPRLPGLSHTTPVLGDLDGDGVPEVIAAAPSALIAYRADGSVLFTRTIVNDFLYYSSIALGDVTGDGLPEIFIGTQQGNLYGFTGTGVLLPGWPVATAGGQPATSPLIVDLDGDGTRDVLFLGADGTLLALGANGAAICPPVTLGALALASPAVGDLDGDGLGEVIATTYGGGIFRLGLPGPWRASRAAWPMALANERHTGVLPRF